MTLTPALIAVDLEGSLQRDPSTKQCQDADSVHVLAFSSKGDLLLVESEGEFNLNIWERVYAEAIQLCRGNSKQEDTNDISMISEPENDMESFVRNVVGDKIAKDQQWKERIK